MTMSETETRPTFQFGLYSLLVAMTAAAVWLWCVANWPQVTIFASSLIVSGLCAQRVVRRWRGREKRSARLLAATALAWLALYLTGVGPAAAVFVALRWDDDPLEAFYAPLLIIDSQPGMRRNYAWRAYTDYVNWWERQGARRR